MNKLTDYTGLYSLSYFSFIFSFNFFIFKVVYYYKQTYVRTNLLSRYHFFYFFTVYHLCKTQFSRLYLNSLLELWVPSLGVYQLIICNFDIICYRFGKPGAHVRRLEFEYLSLLLNSLINALPAPSIDGDEMLGPEFSIDEALSLIDTIKFPRC